MPINPQTGQSYIVVSYPKAGYHGHRYADGHVVAVKGPHTIAEEGGNPAQASSGFDPNAAPPPDPQLEQQRIAAQQTNQIGAAWDNYQRAQLSNTYGIGDTSNPYSRAKLLEDSYKRAQGSTLNNYANQGQLYSGALNVAQNEDQRQNSISNDQMQRSYADAMANITKGSVDRYASTGQTLDNATLNSILQALQQMR